MAVTTPAPVVAAAALDFLKEKWGDWLVSCGFMPANFQAGGSIEIWADRLRKSTAPDAEQELISARQIVGGALCAWSKIAEIANDELRASAKKQLRHNVMAVLPQSGPPGTRADEQVKVVYREKGQAFADLLLARIH